MFKRGLSGIVTSVLLIMFALVAIGILAFFVRDTATDSLKNIGTSQYTLQFDIPLGLVFVNHTSKQVFLTVHRKAGQGDLQGFVIVLEDNFGNSQTNHSFENTTVRELETVRIVFKHTLPGNVVKITVAPLIRTAGGTQLGIPISEIFIGEDGTVGSGGSGPPPPPRSTRWQRVNGGNPIDLGKNLTSGEIESLPSMVDGSGNVVYFFRDEITRSTYTGRFNVVDKKWEIFSINGWSAVDNALGEIFSGSNHYIGKVRMIVDPRNTAQLMGVHSSIANIGGNIFDSHGDAYAFSFDNGLRYWTGNGVAPSAWNAQALAYSFAGTGGSRFDVDFNNEAGLYVGTFGGFNQNYLVATRYDFAQNQWLVWNTIQDNWVSPVSFPPSVLPFMSVSDKAGRVYVRAVPGTRDFLILYENTPFIGGSLYAALYRDSTHKWFGWNNGWVNGMANQLISVMPQELQTFSLPDALVIVYKEDTELKMILYNKTTERWTLPDSIGTIYSSFSDFAVALGSDSVPWLVYRTSGTNYSQRSFVDGVWSAPNVVYSTDSSFHSLAGLSFVNNLPLLFTIEREAGINRMFAVSSNADDYWNNEQIRVPTSFSTNAVLDTSKGAEFSRWDNNFLTTLATGVTEPVAYGATPCGMLELDADGYLYCPKIIVGSVSIFPPNYVDSSSPELARSWGNFWEYFSFPSGVAVDDTRGRVYIADSLVADGGGNYMPVGRVQIWDRVNRTNNISYAWYGLANPPGEFYRPSYVSLPSGQRFNWPADVAVDDTRGILYVSESQAHRIAKFDVNEATPVFIGFMGSEGTEQGQFRFPQGIEVDAQGNFYVVDSYNHRIQKFAPDGTFMSWGEPGRGPGEFYYPFAIAVDRVSGFVYVSEPYNERVQIFDSNGNYVYSFGSWNVPSSVLVARDFAYVMGLAAHNNQLFVSTGNLGNSRIVVFNMTLP